jgi:callose synthase
LKTRNLVQEFRGPRAPGAPPVVIVGFREHIFTGSVSSLANYMALQELSFVTLGQRVLADPLHMRLHYGHPDIFDKLWFTTRGGVSKASRGINLSEDIFAGYTAVIRGGGVTMREYAQVGKGRDVGMQQIYRAVPRAGRVSRGGSVGLPAVVILLFRGDRSLHQLSADRGYHTSGYVPIFTISCLWC